MYILLNYRNMSKGIITKITFNCKLSQKLPRNRTTEAHCLNKWPKGELCGWQMSESFSTSASCRTQQRVRSWSHINFAVKSQHLTLVNPYVLVLWLWPIRSAMLQQCKATGNPAALPGEDSPAGSNPWVAESQPYQHRDPGEERSGDPSPDKEPEISCAPNKSQSKNTRTSSVVPTVSPAAAANTAAFSSSWLSSPRLQGQPHFCWKPQITLFISRI